MIHDGTRIRCFPDSSFAVSEASGWYGVVTGDESCRYPYSEVEAYLAEHPEALVPEPVPPPPTPEEIAARQRAEALAYLASTDWYVIREADNGEAMPADIKAARQAARESL